MTPADLLAEAMAHFGYTDAIWGKSRPTRTRPGGTFARLWSHERAKVWAYLRDKGLSYPVIASTTQTTHSTIIQAMREAGLKLELRALARDRATIRATIAHDDPRPIRAPKAPKPAPNPKPAPKPIPATPAAPVMGAAWRGPGKAKAPKPPAEAPLRDYGVNRAIAEAVPRPMADGRLTAVPDPWARDDKDEGYTGRTWDIAEDDE